MNSTYRYLWWFVLKLSGEGGTVPELLFEKKQLIPAVQQLLVSYLH